MTIHVRYTKWDGSLHWHFEMIELGSDEHGLWLGAPDGTPVRRGEETPVRSQAFALLVPRSGWWTAVWNDTSPGTSGFSFEVYLDVCTPPERTEDEVGAIDLDLDVARRPDGTTVLLDQDEFDRHRRRYGYPARIVDHARAAAAEMFPTVESHTEPFGVVGRFWLERAVALD
ncbi:MAG TPA: DUF402 domain-containing protein [Acidimicrobiia bacterium]